jgi:superfamily II helicase
MYLLNPKKRSSKTKLNSKIIQGIEKEKRNVNGLLLNNSNKDAITAKYFIVCRSCFWYYPVNNYFKKGIDSKQHTICPLCANNNIKYLLISYDRLFRYISTNIN